MTEFIAALPAGGDVHLQSEDEVIHWTKLSEGYRNDYRLTKVNDLTNLGILLVHHLTLYRAQRSLTGMEPEFDDEGLPTGRFKRITLESGDRGKLQKEITEASKEIRQTEQAMGVDKKSRESSGSFTMVGWIETMKRAAHDYGVHISERVQALEEFRGELSWRVRLNANGDAEDKAYMECSDTQVLTWVREELAKLEEVDKEFAGRQALVLGRGVGQNGSP
jgi:hypothetical protein